MRGILHTNRPNSFFLISQTLRMVRCVALPVLESAIHTDTDQHYQQHLWLNVRSRNTAIIYGPKWLLSRNYKHFTETTTCIVNHSSTFLSCRKCSSLSTTTTTLPICFIVLFFPVVHLHTLQCGSARSTHWTKRI